jgi:tRNA uridine 5-carbamoylmethylation protein Kti12
MAPPLLVLITGPIASGKTTTARSLAQRHRDAGRSSAAIDLDDFVEMVAGSDWSSVRREHWQIAGRAAVAAIGSLLDSGIESVYLAGPFFSARLRALILDALASHTEVACVVLDVSLDETIRRAAGDTHRGLTSDPDFIRKIFATIVWDELSADTIRVAADHLELEAVLDEIEQALAALQRR